MVTLSRQDIRTSTPAQAAAAHVSATFGATHGPTVGSAGPAPSRSIVTRVVTIDSNGRWTVKVLGSDAAGERHADAAGLSRWSSVCC